MKRLITEALGRYGAYREAARLAAGWLEREEDADMRLYLTLARARAEAIDAWLSPLGGVEREAVRQCLIERAREPDATALVALGKICAAAKPHAKMLSILFADIAPPPDKPSKRTAGSGDRDAKQG